MHLNTQKMLMDVKIIKLLIPQQRTTWNGGFGL